MSTLAIVQHLCPSHLEYIYSHTGPHLEVPALLPLGGQVLLRDEPLLQRLDLLQLRLERVHLVLQVAHLRGRERRGGLFDMHHFKEPAASIRVASAAWAVLGVTGGARPPRDCPA